MIDIEMPEKCCECPCFHAEHPMHCQLIKPPDKNKRLAAPYGLPRPDWCPLLHVDGGTVGMTDRERAIVMAYTGVVMLCGDKLHIFYEYVSEKLGRPIWTHEFISQADTIKELSKKDFLGLCAGKSYSKHELGKGAKQND